MNKLHRKPRGGGASDQFLLNKNARATIIFHSCQKLIIKTSKGKAASTQKLVSHRHNAPIRDLAGLKT
jgi:hypothetical protein